MSTSVVRDNEGTRTVQLSDRDGLVVMHFERAVRWCALDPSTAAAFAEAVARAAYKAVAGDTPTTQDKSQITEQMRLRLVKRVELMLKTFDGAVLRPDHKVQASQIVDACMKETL